jgi:site-specific DNA-methyltransferase (adenine-specific)
MRLFSENKDYKLYHGSMLDMLDHIQPNSIDSIVTDPPYELNFMGKGWDNSGVSFQPETWKKCYEVLKPGGHMLVFGGSRTFHRIACAIEDAGFEIRDTIMWIYGSGFPKSMNIGLAIDKKNGVESPVVAVKEHCKKDFKDGNLYAQADANKNNTKCFGYGTQEVREPQNEWKGWGTCLKPSFEPIIVVRKPPEGTLVDNVLTYGVGGINIDECRVPMSDNEPDKRVGTDAVMHTDGEKMWYGENGYAGKDVSVYKDNGRFPANTILTYDESDYEEVCGGFPSSGSGNNKGVYNYSGREYNNKDTSMFNGDKPQAPSNYNDNGSASRYFYCAKASKKDRDEGLEEFEEKQIYSLDNKHRFNYKNTDANNLGDKILNISRKNTHPTVKPTELMQYLVRLVTPNGGTVLDPFNGSGSTGKAVMYENREKNKGYKYIGIELNEEYLPISKARIEHLIDEKELEVSKVEFVKPIETLPSNKEVSLW